MSSSKKTIPFFYPWTDPSQVGAIMNAPLKPWDGTSWVAAPPILGFAPDTEAAAQFVNYLHKQHDTSDLQLLADQVQREFSSVIVATSPIATLQISRSIWDPLARRWLHVGNAGGATKKIYHQTRPANGLSDITFAAPEWAIAGTLRSITVPRNSAEATQTAPGGGTSRFMGVVGVGAGSLFAYRVDSTTGVTDVVPGTAGLPGSGTGLTSCDCSVVTENISGGKLFSFCTATGDGQFHILETPTLFGQPISATTSYGLATVYPYSRFRYLRSPDESQGEGYGDVDCIFEIGSWGVGTNPHKVFRRRWGTGVPVWTKQDEPFAVNMETSSGTQSTVLGVAYDRRLQGIVVAIYRYDGSNKGVEFVLYDPQSGLYQNLAVSTHVWDELTYRDGINVNGFTAAVYPCAFEIYNDTWIILVGGTSASTQAIFSFDVGASWHAEPSGTMNGAAAWAQGPGALSVQGPEVNAGGRGFVYRPSHITGIALNQPALAASPAGGNRTGPYT